MSEVAFIAAYCLFTFSVLRGRGVYPGYLLGLFVFMTIQFGPHTALLPGYLRISPMMANNAVDDAYCYFMACFYTIVGASLLVLKRSHFSPKLDAMSLRPISRSGIRWAYGIATVMLLLSFALQPGLSVTVEHLRVILGQSIYSYTEVRRTLFEGSPWFMFANVMRFTVVPALFGIFCLQALVTRSLQERMMCWGFALSLVLVVSIQINKFYFLYFAFLLSALFLMVRARRIPRANWSTIAKWLPSVGIGAGIFALGIYVLYQFQYSEALEAGQVSILAIRETLLFRVFFASSDALRLWIDYFYFGGNAAGLSAISKLCTLTPECVNANTLIPQLYVGDQLTTMQVGFIGTALSTIGLLGVPIVSMVIVVVVALNGRVQALFNNSAILLPLSVHMFLNAFFLTTRELHTALLSGGAVSVPLFYLAYYLLARPVARFHDPSELARHA